MAVHVSPAHALERLAHRMPMEADKTYSSDNVTARGFVDPRFREMFAFSVAAKIM
jgi:hypothetical protein